MPIPPRPVRTLPPRRTVARPWPFLLCGFAALWLGWSGFGVGAAPLAVGLGVHPATGPWAAEEWAWALRGGGAELQRLDPDELKTPPAGLSLLILDSIPLDAGSRRGLEAWVRQGGLLIWAGSPALLSGTTAGRTPASLHGAAAELLGVRLAGFDPGLPGSYPRITATSPLLSPLLPGDALRLGNAGVAQGVRLEPAGAEVLARSARLSPGPGGLVLDEPEPTVLSHKLGAGRVLVLGFSPGRVAACDPDPARYGAARDCSGAGSAHALMRWLAANLLWEEKHLQLPLLWEAPGDLPHAFIVTGDVHDHSEGWEVKAAVTMARLFERLKLPLSLYLTGRLGDIARAELEALRSVPNLELGTHSLDGRIYTRKDFGFHGWGEARGILKDIRAAEARLKLPGFPGQRAWLASTRSHGWQSDPAAWDAMQAAGIGLAFDQVSDRLEQRTPWRVPAMWFGGDERRRLFVPLYEHAVSSAAGDFRLDRTQRRDIALLASGQPEPYAMPANYSDYSDHVLRWHRLFGRLATVGGLTEVWLWHPGGIASRVSVDGRAVFDEVERVVREVQGEPAVRLLRGDVAATWRANRERFPVRPVREADGRLTGLTLLPPGAAPVPLPPNSPREAATISFWVIGPANLPGWTARSWTDPAGRVVTVLVHPLPEVRP